jgi:SH3-like domain-containing protein
MTNGSPAMHLSRRPPGLRAIGFSVAWFLTLCVALPSARAEGNTFVITGAERVLVRRGPGAAFPPFVTLTRGSTVEVREMRGEWARIVTAKGQTGYVNSTFLALPNERPKEHAAAAAPTPTAPAVAAPATTPMAELAALRAAAEHNKDLEAQVRGLQQEVVELKTRAEATHVPAPTTAAACGGGDHVPAELTRLSTAVEGLQRRLEARPAADAPASSGDGAGDGGPHILSPSAIFLGMVGVVAGWVLGISYGRKQERGRRSRIRF